MLSPLSRLEISLEEFENSSEDIKKLAAFCAEFLEAVKFSLN
jgi:hypothetical protein